jgi:transcriptional regulator with XRE-family HTH domain
MTRGITRSIGQRIRDLRLKKGITLSAVSSETGLTPSLLSQVERDLANPSVSSLRKIAEALSVSIGSFFEDADLSNHENNERLTAPASRVVHESNRKVLSPCPGITYYLLTEDLQGQIEFILAVFEVGADTGEELLSHEGEECCLVLEGKGRIQVGDDSYSLEKGCSLRFNCALPHRVRNAGHQVLKAIWVITPPSF